MAANRHSLATIQTDTALTSDAVSVLITSTAILADRPGRAEVTIVNTDAANPVYLAFSTVAGTAPTAIAVKGVKLAAGASWTSGAYTGAIAGIAVGGTVVVTVAEF